MSDLPQLPLLSPEDSDEWMQGLRRMENILLLLYICRNQESWRQGQNFDVPRLSLTCRQSPFFNQQL